jgi:hypothetical protein
MVRRGLVIGLVAVVLGLVPLLATACSGSKAAAMSLPPAAQPRLLDIGGFSLLAGRSTGVMLHATSSHPLRVFVLADHRLDSIALRRVARADGGLISPVAIPLRGSPHDTGNHAVYGLSTASIEPGYYRLTLRGQGLVRSLAVTDW